MNICKEIKEMINDKLGDVSQDVAEITLALKGISKAIPFIKSKIFVGDDEKSVTAHKAIDTLAKFTDTLIKDIKSGGVNDKTKRGIANYLSVIDRNINSDIMKGLPKRKEKQTMIAIDMISRATSQINTLYRLRKV